MAAPGYCLQAVRKPEKPVTSAKPKAQRQTRTRGDIMVDLDTYTIAD
jgi:hypothetical protein